MLSSQSLIESHIFDLAVKEFHRKETSLNSDYYTGGDWQNCLGSQLSLYPIIFSTYKEVLFWDKKLSLQAIVTVTVVTMIEVLCTLLRNGVSKNLYTLVTLIQYR